MHKYSFFFVKINFRIDNFQHTTMSNNIESSNEWANWIEEAISKGHIKYYEYDHFSNFQEIGCGNFGKVYRVNWKNSHGNLALKSFFNLNHTTIKEIVNEVNYKINIYL